MRHDIDLVASSTVHKLNVMALIITTMKHFDPAANDYRFISGKTLHRIAIETSRRQFVGFFNIMVISCVASVSAHESQIIRRMHCSFAKIPYLEQHCGNKLHFYLS